MKRVITLLVFMGLALFSAAQAQVIADFEVAASATGGFADNGWGAAINGGVARIADPTGVSGFVLGLNYNAAAGGAQSGVIEKTNYDPKNGHVISMRFKLPADFPDDATIQFWGQDNSHWSHTTETYNGVDVPKGKWVELDFHIKGLNLANPTTFNPYSPNLFGKWGVAIATSGNYTGQILIDDVTLLGDVPKAISDFEVAALGVDGWFDANWGPGMAGVVRAADPVNAANTVIQVNLDAALGTRATLEKDAIPIPKDGNVIGIKVYVPADLPDAAFIQICGQDNQKWGWNPQVYNVSALKKGQWNEIYYDVRHIYDTDSTSFIPFTAGTWGKIVIDLDGNTSYTGPIYYDDIAWFQPAPPPTAELLSPAITVTAGMTDMVDPFTGEVFYYNDIAWTDLSADIGESYSVYYSASKITDVNAAGVIQLGKNIGRGRQIWHHRLYTLDGAQKTVYYAVTVTGLEGGNIVEKPVRDGISNGGPATAKTSLLYEIPLVNNFPFAADGYLDEFEALTAEFKRLPLRNQEASGDESAAWDTASTDLNFKGYIVTDGDNLFIGMDVTDDLPHGDAQCWAGDGFDFMSGLYDVKTLTKYWRGNDAGGGAVTDPGTGGAFRIGSAIGPSQANHIQYNGYAAWDPAGAEYAQDIFDGGYIVEMKIPYASLDAQFNGGSFKPAEGMLLPGKIDLNDNDTESTTGTRTLQNHWGDVPGGYNSWQRAEAWTAPFVVTSTHIVTDWTDVEASGIKAPYEFALNRNYPNPFNPSTTIQYQMAKQGNVKLSVFDVNGRELAVLMNGHQTAGNHTIEWNGKDRDGMLVGSGVYFIKMAADQYEQTQKMLLVK